MVVFLSLYPLSPLSLSHLPYLLDTCYLFLPTDIIFLLFTVYNRNMLLCYPPHFLSLHVVSPIKQDIISNINFPGKNIMVLVLIMCPLLFGSNMIAQV